MKRALLCALVGLTGCVSAGESVPGPSGAVVQQTKCSGSPTACLKQANTTCKGPYQVLDSSSNAGGMLADIMPGPVTWYRMSYQCGPTDGRMPTFQFRGPNYVAPPMVINQPATTSSGPINCRSTRAPDGAVRTVCN